MEWTFENIRAIYELPLFPLLSKAHLIHQEHHNVGEIQLCYLISFKTGGCPENCNYCSQSNHYQTHVKPLPLLSKQKMLDLAESAIKQGATRICLVAAWRGVKEGKAFNILLETAQELNQKGVEVCGCLGLLEKEHAVKLQEAGFYAYNHNLDTSENHYSKIITTRNFHDRLETLSHIKEVGLSPCCGGILGVGETEEDRISLIHTLATKVKPESVPINFLIPIEGTPLENSPPLSIWEMVRMIATVRVVLPDALIRLSAGRLSRSWEEQALCFFAGANSIHIGEKLLTTSNNDLNHDAQMLATFGIQGTLTGGRKKTSCCT